MINELRVPRSVALRKACDALKQILDTQLMFRMVWCQAVHLVRCQREQQPPELPAQVRGCFPFQLAKHTSTMLGETYVG